MTKLDLYFTSSASGSYLTTMSRGFFEKTASYCLGNPPKEEYLFCGNFRFSKREYDAFPAAFEKYFRKFQQKNPDFCINVTAVEEVD